MHDQALGCPGNFGVFHHRTGRSGTRISRPTNRLVASVAAAVFVLAAFQQGLAQTIDENLWTTDGAVYTILQDEGTVYIGGSFTRVGPATGAGVPIGAGGALPASFPRVNGSVSAVAPDGTGGWYIGGLFTQVGGLPRENLAHLAADLSVSNWNPGANSEVLAIAVSGSTVYVGGRFSLVAGEWRNRIAAIDAATGAASGWDPQANQTVSVLVVNGTTIYAGGAFTNIGGQARDFIAALDAGTGSATTWNPDPDGTVTALAVSGWTVYAGGHFRSIGGQARDYIAGLDVGTGAATGWNPDANREVSALVAYGSTVYAGGDFDNIGGQSRRYIAAVDTTTGLATSWNPDADAWVRALAVNGSTIYAGGYFTDIGGQTRFHVAALARTTGLATDWNPDAGGAVFALAVSGSTVYVGGEFNSIGRQVRNNIAALDAVTGAATAWDPNADNTVRVLALSGATMYAGGEFASIGRSTRHYIAALDTVNGDATGWNPNAGGPSPLCVYALEVSDSTVYVGGSFGSIGGQSRNNIAALDVGSGLAPAWNPNANGRVNALGVDGSTVYVGGYFSSIGGQPRGFIAALDATSGLATTWNPSANDEVLDLEVSGSTVYAGGAFTQIGAQARDRIAALDAGTGLATGWNPGSNDLVNALDVYESSVFAAGAFTYIGDRWRNYLAEISLGGWATGWNPNPDGWAYSLAVTGSTIYAGGAFFNVGGLWRSGLAAIEFGGPIERACCLSQGQCVPLTEAECTAWGGTWFSEYGSCRPSPCPGQYACCLGSETCEVLSEHDCNSMEGEWREGQTECPPTCDASVYHVRPDGTGDFPTIQEALDAAWTDDQILLAEGTYTGPGNRDLDYHGRGIFVQAENVTPLATIIDCENAGRGILFDDGESESAAIIGVTIQNGAAARGAGILCQDSRPTIRECVFLNNAASESGGAISFDGFYDLMLDACVFVGNTAGLEGGAVDCGTFAQPFFTLCVFDRNLSGESGACVSIRADAQASFSACILAFGMGGEAIACQPGGQPGDLYCCDIFGNEGGDYVGCIASFAGINDNFSADPLFCGEANPMGYYAVAEDSPCAPENNPACGLVGVMGIGCAMNEVEPGGGGEYGTIQSAVDGAVDGDIVMLASGTYEGEGNRGISMYGKMIIIRTQSRGGRGGVIDCGGVTRGFVFDAGEGAGAVLDGLTIENGRAEYGAAVFCSTGTSPLLLNCTFSNCVADGDGGGLYCWTGASPTVTGCHFLGDSALQGGAVSCRSGAAPAFEGSFLGDNGAQEGGGVYCAGGSAPSFSLTTLVRNRASQGGAMYCAAGADPALTRCTLVENEALQGGGMYSASALPQVTRTIIAFGTNGGAAGGTAAPTFSCCDIYGNTGGDWTGPIAGQLGLRNNISYDPLFCDRLNGNYSLWNSSPCNQVTCGVIGAWDVGCTDPMGWEPPPEAVAAPAEIFLAAGRPNPSSGLTRIVCRIPAGEPRARVRLGVYDVSGRLVRMLIDQALSPGSYEFDWNGADEQGRAVGAGLYFCRLGVGAEEAVERVIRVR